MPRMNNADWWAKNNERALTCLTEIYGLDKQSLLRRLNAAPPKGLADAEFALAKPQYGDRRFPAAQNLPVRRKKGRPKVDVDPWKVHEALEQHGGSVRAAASALGLSRATVTRCIQRGDVARVRALEEAPRTGKNRPRAFFNARGQWLYGSAEATLMAFVRDVAPGETSADLAWLKKEVERIKKNRPKNPKPPKWQRERDARRALRAGQEMIPLGETPYSKGLAEALKALGGLWDGDEKQWYIPEPAVEQAKRLVTGAKKESLGLSVVEGGSKKDKPEQ